MAKYLYKNLKKKRTTQLICLRQGEPGTSQYSTVFYISILLDHHCIQLVKEGVTEKLLCLLKQPEIPPTLQHAVFSALRNMAIPSESFNLRRFHQKIPHVLLHV